MPLAAEARLTTTSIQVVTEHFLHRAERCTVIPPSAIRRPGCFLARPSGLFLAQSRSWQCAGARKPHDRHPITGCPSRAGPGLMAPSDGDPFGEVRGSSPPKARPPAPPRPQRIRRSVRWPAHCGRQAAWKPAHQGARGVAWATVRTGEIARRQGLWRRRQESARRFQRRQDQQVNQVRWEPRATGSRFARTVRARA